MEIHVHASQVELDLKHIEARVAKALERFAVRMTRVEVFVRDLNAAKGGIDKRCVLEARPRGLDPLAAEHEAASTLDAITGALGKLERLLEHRFGRLGDR